MFGSPRIPIRKPKELTHQEKLQQSVCSLGVKVRIQNALQADRVNTIGDLLECADKDLLAIPNLGEMSLKEIDIKLADIGLKRLKDAHD